LNSQGLLTTADDDFLRESIARGRPGANGQGRPGTKMPIFDEALGGPLTGAEMDQIVGYVRSWQTEPSVELAPYEARGDTQRGAGLYATYCAACHGADGWSKTAPSLAGETFQETADDSFIRHTILNGRPGTTMVGYQLGETEVADVIAFVRSLGRE
jgi:mono/diheme cytochrome c family protein